jgi:hypothetical protein
MLGDFLFSCKTLISGSEKNLELSWFWFHKQLEPGPTVGKIIILIPILVPVLKSDSVLNY